MKKKSVFKRNTGFTLLEVLLVLSLLSVSMFAVTTAFLQGSRVFHRLNQVLSEEKNTFLFERLTQDLSSGVYYSGIPWIVTSDSLSFPSLRDMKTPPEKITYRWDPEARALTRDQEAFPYSGSIQTDREILATGLDRVSFAIPERMENRAPQSVIVTLESRKGTVTRTIRIFGGYKEASSG